MLRFILNFFLFGLLFYAIYFFFPDAFLRLVAWISAVFDWLKDFINHLTDRLNSTKEPAPIQTPALIPLIAFLKAFLQQLKGSN